MIKQVLLARPHPFIVSEMKPFLEQSGFSPVQLHGISELVKLTSTTLSGVIISLAVQSTIEETAEMVFGAIRRQFPYLPVAFAGMLDGSMASKAIKRLLPEPAETFHVIGTEVKNERRVELGRPSTFVYIRNSDLSAPETGKIAARILQRHFSVQ